MKPKLFMLIAGETSGDLLAAELVRALRSTFERHLPPPSPEPQPLTAELAPAFFGAGGPQMAAAGVELALDLTQHSVIGLSDALKKYFQFKGIFDRLFELARQREPDAIICVDFSGFNRRFAHAIKECVRRRRGWFRNWDPKIIQYVSPQVWASRPGRVRQLAEDLDLLLSIIPFEKAWYAEHAPKLRVEFVGHPIVDRYRATGAGRSPKPATLSPERAVQSPEVEIASPKSEVRRPNGEGSGTGSSGMVEQPSCLLPPPSAPLVLLLPGSRVDELRRHLPVVMGAAKKMAVVRAFRFRMILPDEAAARRIEPLGSQVPGLEVCVARLADAFTGAELAITKSGTITLECAYFGVPAVVFYKTSWPTYFMGRAVVKTKFIAMPNLLAGESIYPELIQHAATAQNIAQAALGLLNDAGRRASVSAELAEVSRLLGGPGASERAAETIWGLFENPRSELI